MNGDTRTWSAERLAAVACVAVAAAFLLGPYVLREDLFNNDAAHHIFWLYRYSDPTLFQGDVAVDYFRTSAPWGYRALYTLLAPSFDVLSAAEWLSVALLVLCAVLAWNIGKVTSGSNSELHALLAVAALCIMMLLSQQQDLLPPLALQRAFALPLLLVTVWALLAERNVFVGLSWIFAALFYPVVLPVQALTAAIVYSRQVLRQRRLPTAWVFNAVAGGVACLITTVGMPIPLEIGPALTYEQAMQLPEFGPDGRLRLYGEGLGSWLRDHRTGLGWSVGDLAWILAGVAAAWLGGARTRIPFAAWAMMCVGVGIWVAMRAFPNELMFGLYLPNRHARWAVGIFGVVAIAAGASALVERFGRLSWSKTSGRQSVMRPWLVLMVPAAVGAAVVPHGVAVWNQPVDEDLEKVYAFLLTLPKTALVASHPDLADFVPVRSQRSVLTSTEISMAWMEGYYEIMKPRVVASLRAAYATRIQDIDCELAPYGVDVMVTGPPVFRKTRYFAPFDTLVQALIARGLREGFVLKRPPAERVLFRSGGYYVVRVEACSREGNP